MAGPLANTRQERFAQEMAKGSAATRAYVAAGYNPSESAPARLCDNVRVKARIVELQQRAADRAEVSIEKVLRELAKIGFSDIRKAVAWSAQAHGLIDNPETGEPQLAIRNQVELVDSGEIDEDTAAAISEVSQNATGGIRVKFHDKRAALVDIGRHLGMFTDNVRVGGPNGEAMPAITVTLVAAK